MNNNNNFKDFDNFILNAKEDEIEIIEKYYKDNKINIDKKYLDKLNQLESSVNLIVFSELYCKDAAIVLPILNGLSEKNNLINIKYTTREDNETLIEELSGDKRVPTILKLNNDGKVIGKYIEFPKCVKNILENKGDLELLRGEFRNGVYNKELLKELIELIID